MHQRAQVTPVVKTAVRRKKAIAKGLPEESDFSAGFVRDFRLSVKYTQLAKNKHRFRIVVTRKGRAPGNSFVERPTLFCESQILTRREFSLYGATPEVHYKGYDELGNLQFELASPGGIATLAVTQKVITIQSVHSLK